MFFSNPAQQVPKQFVELIEFEEFSHSNSGSQFDNQDLKEVLSLSLNILPDDHREAHGHDDEAVARRLGSVGRPVPGIEVRQILDEAQTYYHFGVRKDWPQLVTILNRGIASWRAMPAFWSKSAVTN